MITEFVFGYCTFLFASEPAKFKYIQTSDVFVDSI